MNALVPMPVMLPMLGAGICLVLGRSARAQRIVSLAVLGVVVAISGVLLWKTDASGPQVVDVGGWGDLGISLVADRMSALLLLVSSIVTLCVLAYSLGQGIVEYGRDTPLSVYHPTYLVLVAGVSIAFLSGDLFNLYVGFEVLLAASYVLITLGGTPARVRAGTTYIVVSLLSSVLFLIAIAMVYAATGTINLASLASRIDDLPDGVTLILQLMLLTAFGIKAAVFPLSAWLPDSYPTAPAPVTAVFAGLLTKVGVYAMIRVQTLLFPDSPLEGLLLIAALLTMVIGILGAVAQSDIKRLLSFTLLSHIGYMIFGLALATTLDSPIALAGTIYYVIHHITVQTTLFLVSGLVEIRGGSTNLDLLGGLARLSPVLAILFFIPAMNLAGIPPFSGFLGKVALLQAGAEAGTWLAYVLVAGAVVTSLLTLYAMAKAWNRAFWQSPPDSVTDAPTDAALHGGDGILVDSGARTTRLPLSLVVPTALLVAVGIAFTVAAGPLFGLAERSADELRERTPYITAVQEAAER
ncbi:Na+/H+ antiporter subunit D [Nocardioidaceae bacterium SCSIO 66511]|nr:Na+/H+ antiporter subunit D [Nocardioidaceae bacterium SCSIO 66511]